MIKKTLREIRENAARKRCDCSVKMKKDIYKSYGDCCKVIELESLAKSAAFQIYPVAKVDEK